MATEGYAVIVQGISGLEGVEELPARSVRNLTRAINRTARYARTLASEEMRKQVAFKPRYLTDDSRLSVNKLASASDLQAVVIGRNRPTSLARFAKPAGRKGGATITVQPGLARHRPKAFFVRLRAGAADLTNTGIAIRLPEGERPGRAYKPKLLGKNLWLLYGPSVGQVFDDVAEDISNRLGDYLETEYNRLMDLEDV